MENIKQNLSSKEGSPEVLPSLIKAITAHEVVGFDSIQELHHPSRLSAFVSYTLSIAFIKIYSFSFMCTLFTSLNPIVSGN